MRRARTQISHYLEKNAFPTMFIVGLKRNLRRSNSPYLPDQKSRCPQLNLPHKSARHVGEDEARNISCLNICGLRFFWIIWIWKLLVVFLGGSIICRNKYHLVQGHWEHEYIKRVHYAMSESKICQTKDSVTRADQDSHSGIGIFRTSLKVFS